MFINQIMFIMMCTQGILCVLLTIPHLRHIAQVIARAITKIYERIPLASYVGDVVSAMVALLFLSNVHTLYKHRQETEVMSDSMRIRHLSAQRDVYITGFNLFLFMMLRLVYSGLERNNHLEKNFTVMEKQAKGASEGYKKLVDENTDLNAKLHKCMQLDNGSSTISTATDSTTPTTVSGDSTTVSTDSKDKDKDNNKSKDSGKSKFMKLLDENVSLDKKVKEMEIKIKNLNVEVETVKKQAAGQSGAFMNLCDEKTKLEAHVDILQKKLSTILTLERTIEDLKAKNQTLEKQVQDYDFMFGDQKKKEN